MKKGEKWYKSPSNWVVVVACVILIPILLMNLSIMFQAKANPEKIPNVFGFKPFIVLSGSMEPGIHKGDMIITKIVDANTLGVNDIIAFKDAEGTVTTHRIIDVVTEKGETAFITKGDNNSSQDRNLVSLSDVEGIYKGRIPGVGSIMNSLSEPTTIIIVVLGITMIFVIGFIISTKKQTEQERKELLEYKRMKAQKMHPEEEDDEERKEFLEYKKMKEEYAQKERNTNNEQRTNNYTRERENRGHYENNTQYRNNNRNYGNYENNRNREENKERYYDNRERRNNNGQYRNGNNNNQRNYQNNRGNYHNNSKNNYKK